MSDPAVTELAVSIQADDLRSEPWRGHLAAGVLLDADTVLVPAAPDVLVDDAVTFEVLVLPLPLSVEQRIERIRPDRLGALRFDSAEGTALATVVKLARPTRHRLELPAYDGCALGEALRNRGNDLWAALLDIGLVTENTRYGPPEDVLHQVPDMERQQWRDQVRTFSLDIPPENWICFFTPRCNPCQP